MVASADIPSMEEGAACAQITKIALADRSGSYIPNLLLHKGKNKMQLPSSLKIDLVQYLRSMHAYMEAADLTVNHPGSGNHSLGMPLQRGDGEYIPNVLLTKGQNKAQLPSGLKIEVVQYLPSMHAYMEAADLIISHAGSGSLFEALSLGRVIIAVPNAILMANHQVTFQPASSSSYAIDLLA